MYEATIFNRRHKLQLQHLPKTTKSSLRLDQVHYNSVDVPKRHVSLSRINFESKKIADMALR